MFRNIQISVSKSNFGCVIGDDSFISCRTIIWKIKYMHTPWLELPIAPLHEAAAYGQFDRVFALYEAGHDMDIKSKINRTTPLEYAIISNNEEMVRTLIDIGANPFEYIRYISDGGVGTYLHLARDNRILLALLEYGLDPNIDGLRLIEQSISETNGEIFDTLVSIGVSCRMFYREEFVRKRNIDLIMADPAFSMFDRRLSHREQVSNIVRLALTHSQMARIAAIQIFAHSESKKTPIPPPKFGWAETALASADDATEPAGTTERSARDAAMGLVKIEHCISRQKHHDRSDWWYVELQRVDRKDWPRIQKMLFPIGWRKRMMMAAMARGAVSTVQRVLGWAEVHGEAELWRVVPEPFSLRSVAPADATAWDVENVMDESRLE
jgi:hypothetical protein